ncbi:MAG TPA: adenylate/guanylate cyclase domain-containing protein [Geminicoccaceae bacterium]|nr:adenylate/guanylate cyclase domain-containing protein [Geminicoccaceae bacterium]
MARARAGRRLAAILAADVVGYSSLIERDEAGTLAAIRDLRREAIEPLIVERHGRVVKLMGDGAIAEFGSVVDAVACAVAIQKAMAERQVEVPPERRIVFRIGINLGDVVVEGDGEDLLGDGVNVAARLEQLCEPGGVLVSGRPTTTSRASSRGCRSRLRASSGSRTSTARCGPTGCGLTVCGLRHPNPARDAAGGCCPPRSPFCSCSSSPPACPGGSGRKSQSSRGIPRSRCCRSTTWAVTRPPAGSRTGSRRTSSPTCPASEIST